MAFTGIGNLRPVRPQVTLESEKARWSRLEAERELDTFLKDDEYVALPFPYQNFVEGHGLMFPPRLRSCIQKAEVP